MVSSEVESFARTGGLGDVVMGLSRALVARGAAVAIVTPMYGNTRIPDAEQYWWSDRIPARHGWGPDDVLDVGVLEVRLTEPGAKHPVRVFLVEDWGLFGSRNGIYADQGGTFGDNERRFAVLARAALSVSERIWGAVGWAEGNGPDVIHAHDWHASFAVLYPKLVMGDAWRRVPAVMTIHNLAFQGVLGVEAVDRLGLPREAFHAGVLEYGGDVNLLKGSIALAERVTTVSPTYAREILGPWSGFGLDGFLRDHQHKLVGIVNGIDPHLFDPARDGSIAHRYDAEHVAEGKARCKEALFSELGLWDTRAPLFASVSRLTSQKGIDVALAALPGIVATGARAVFVGSGDADMEGALYDAGGRYPGVVATRVAFDDALARRVYAAADFFMVPSRYEPCGLTQMYAMRYGAVPVVSDVGGLHDTVERYDAVRATGTGFLAMPGDAGSLFLACDEGVVAYRDHVGLAGLRDRGMRRDSSWTRSAEEYVDRVYAPITGGKRP